MLSAVVYSVHKIITKYLHDSLQTLFAAVMK